MEEREALLQESISDYELAMVLFDRADIEASSVRSTDAVAAVCGKAIALSECGECLMELLCGRVTRQEYANECRDLHERAFQCMQEARRLITVRRRTIRKAARSAAQQRSESKFRAVEKSCEAILQSAKALEAQLEQERVRLLARQEELQAGYEAAKAILGDRWYQRSKEEISPAAKERHQVEKMLRDLSALLEQVASDLNGVQPSRT